ncbi:hypothetical protein Q7P36_005905 [Cladosporium allicinum]
MTTGSSTNSSARPNVSNTTKIAIGLSVTANASSILANTIAIPTGRFANASADSCWPLWTDYWTYSNAVANPKTSDVSTVIEIETETQEAYAATTETDISTLTGTSVQDNGGFTISTRTTDSLTTFVYTITEQPGSTVTRTDTYTSITLLSYNGPSIPMPTCQLPSIVLQCQSQWETYASSQLSPSPTPPSHCDINQGLIHADPPEYQPPCASAYHSSVKSWYESLSTITAPPCTQASVSGALCSSIKDAYVHQQNDVFFPSNVSFAPYFSNGYLGDFADVTASDYSVTWQWPTSSTLGVPGCTLGCGRCAVTGNTVQLLYWPEATQSEAQPKDNGPVTISTFGTILTSPTYYISYRSVFASDGCSAVGPTLYNTIVPIPLESPLSSVFGGTIPCGDAHGANGFTQVWSATAPFNVADLINSPVPFSIYSSQPWCATYQYEHSCDKDCPTTDAYKPIIVVPEGVLQDINPAWASCYGDIRGVYDPPIALTQVASVDVPLMTGFLASVSSEAAGAIPASSPSKPATETGGAEALPDSLTSGGVASGGTPRASSFQLARPSQDHGGADVPAVLPDNLPAAGAGGNAPQASHSSGSSGDVGSFVAAILSGNAGSDDDGSSPDRLSGIGGPKEHPDTSSLSNAIGDAVPHGSQASSVSVQGGDGLVAAILGGVQNPVEASPASASQESYNDVAGVLPGASPSGSGDPQDSRSSAFEQDVGDIVAAVLGGGGGGGGGGRLSGTGSALTLESGRPNQTPTAQVSAGQASATSQSSPPASDAYNSDDASTSLVSDASTTTSANESGVDEPISTQASNAGAKSGADGSSGSNTDSASMGTVMAMSDRWIAFGILVIVSVFVL